MDDLPDSALINSPNINSVLKAPKPRVPLKDLMAAVPEEDNTAARKRRVSFANVNKIKEFSAGAESMVVCQTPAYEEPFSVSSDSSYPSGVDGWTPAKGQFSVHGKPPIYPEKENLSIQRMSTGMDLTNVVRDSVRNTRYSVNSMDLTLANSHETYIDQQTRFSLGMDLTNVAGHQSQSTRYSVSGMDLTSVTHSNQDLVDQRTRYSMGMDFNGVAGHSTQSSRYSINGMDLTEAVGSHQTFLDQRSARFSVGMDMTNIVGNTMNTMIDSCNEMDLTEAANPYCYKKQSCEGGFTANVSMDDSDALELTEAVNGVQFSAVSPNYKKNDVGLTQNVLYSVNNTRYSGNSMGMTSNAGSSLSSARRKSSRYSLINMDLTQAINNSCDDLEFTQSIGDPRIKAGSTRNSMCEMDLTESIVDGGVAILSSITSEPLEYSADTESIMNMTKNTSNNLGPPVYDKENVLPNQSFKVISTPAILSCEDPMYVNLKLSNMSLCTAAHEPLSKVTSRHPIISGNEHNYLQNTIPLDKTYEHVLYESPPEIELAPCTFKENLPSYVVNRSKITKQDSKGMSEIEEFHAIENNSEIISSPPIQNKGLEQKILDEKETSCANETLSKLEITVGHLSNEINKEEKTFPLNASNGNMQKHGDALKTSLELDQSNSLKEIKLDKTGLHIDNLEQDATAKQHNSFKTYQEDLTFRDEEPISEQILYEDAMDVSITDNSGLEKHKSSVIREPHSPDIENTEKTLRYPEGICSSNESVMNMSVGNCSLIKEVEDVGNTDEQIKNKDDGFEKDFPVTDSEVNHQTAKTFSSTQEENHQPTVENITAKDQSVELNISSNTSLNFSSRSVLCNKNITMTRGRSKSLIVTPDTSLETSNMDSSRIEGNKATNRIQNTSVTLKTHENDGGLNQSEDNLKHETSSLQSEASLDQRGKRSFEAAFEAENDTGESPIKQLCLSREEPSSEFETLNNVIAPSFLMDTLAASSETLPCIDEHETTAIVHQFKPEPTDPIVSESTCETKQEFSLRMHDSLAHNNMSENPLHSEVIDLCDSSFDATSTDVRELINNSLYKTRNVCDSSGSIDLTPKPCSIKEPSTNNSLNMDNTIGTNILEREVERMCTDPIPPLHHLRSGSRRKREKVRTLGSNSYAGNLIPNLVEIQFSIDSSGYVNRVSYHRISTGCDTVIGEYLLNQARNYMLPEKGSDLIILLESPKESYLVCLARSINIICKYYNGSIKGNILTLEVANCSKRFWTFTDVNIQYPQHLNQADITISKQKIGELKLSHVRKIFNSIEKTQDQLLKFVKAITELQYNN